MWCFCEELTCFFRWLDKWQTLISGGAAVLAAIVTCWLLWRQIRVQRDQIAKEHARAEDARQRRSLSLRAKSPFALDSLSNYAEACLKRTWSPPIPTTSGPPPTLPADAIDRIAELIEFTDNISARYLALLVAQCQINDARIRGGTSHNDDEILMATIIRWLADSAFEYGRLEADRYRPDPSEANVRNALRMIAHESLMHWPDQTREMIARVLPRAVRLAQRFQSDIEARENA